MSATRKPTRKPPAPARLSPALEARLDKLEAAVERVARLQCPYCAPAIIAELHPDRAPQPLRPVEPLEDHADHNLTG